MANCNLIPLLSIGMAAAAFSAGCGSNTQQRLHLLEDQTKLLMVADAEQGFQEIFKSSFNPDKTQLLLGAELEKWVENHRPKARLPEQVKIAIQSHQGVALLIQQGRPGKNGSQQDVVYMRAPQFGFHRIFLNEDPDPCGDGNPSMCEFCSGGCEGPRSSGCYCTLGCGPCHPCPQCAPN